MRNKHPSFAPRKAQLFEVLQYHRPSSAAHSIRPPVVAIETCGEIAVRRLGYFPERGFQIEARLKFVLDFELEYLVEVLRVELKELFPNHAPKELAHEHLTRLMNCRF